jgi:hypothetical protein
VACFDQPGDDPLAFANANSCRAACPGRAARRRTEDGEPLMSPPG